MPARTPGGPFVAEVFNADAFRGLAAGLLAVVAMWALSRTELKGQALGSAVVGGALTAIADSAAGYAALSLMPANRGVLTTEMKINFLAPAAGDRILARGKVLKAGRTLSLVQTEIFTVTAGQEKLIAFLTATFMSIENRDGIED